MSMIITRATDAQRRRMATVLAMAALALIAASSVRLLTHASNSRGRAPNLNIQRVIPASWKMSLDSAEGHARFPVLVPNDPDINANNVSAAYSDPRGDAVALRYPLPPGQSGAAAGLNQDYIQIAESPWPWGDPETFYQQDIAENPDVGKTVCNVGALPALCVEARSPSATLQDNSAFLRVDIDSTDVEISGGSNVARLVAIARSMQNPQHSP